MRYFIVFLLLLQTPSIAKIKECFKDKQSDQLICYKRYFDRHKIHKAKDSEKYYTTPSGKLYAIGDMIEVKFRSIGAILSIINEYDMDFVDKTRGEKYIFKVRNKDKVFPILRKLNNLKSVQKAIPQRERKYSKAYIQYQLKKRQEKLAKIKEDLKNGKNVKKSTNKMTNPNFQGGNFLKGGVSK